MANYVDLSLGQTRVKKIQWTLTSADPNGQFYPHANRYPRKTVHVFGTFGGGTVSMQGSSEVGTPANPYVIKDYLGNSLAFTELGGRGLMDDVVSNIAPFLTGGSGVSVTVIMEMAVDLYGA